MNALDAFAAAKAEADALIAELGRLSDEHLGAAPEETHWGHVGTMEHVRERLAELLAHVRG